MSPRASKRSEALRMPGDNLHDHARGSALLGRTFAGAAAEARR